MAQSHKGKLFSVRCVTELLLPVFIRAVRLKEKLHCATQEPGEQFPLTGDASSWSLAHAATPS